jgi:hypothetical protein
MSRGSYQPASWCHSARTWQQRWSLSPAYPRLRDAVGADGEDRRAAALRFIPRVWLSRYRAQQFRRTIPCATNIVGDTLGVPSAVVCKACKPKGRFHEISPRSGLPQAVGKIRHGVGTCCRVSWQVALGMRAHGRTRRNLSRLQSRPGSRLFRTTRISTDQNRLKRVSPEHPDWKISNGSSRGHP